MKGGGRGHALVQYFIFIIFITNSQLKFFCQTFCWNNHPKTFVQSIHIACRSQVSNGYLKEPTMTSSLLTIDIFIS